MSEIPSVGPEDGNEPSAAETEPGESPENLLLELESLETRLLEVIELVRHLRAENVVLREQCSELLRERDALWRERGTVTSRLAQIIAKVDALRGET